MRIKLLEIKGFGKFTNRRIMPAESFNVVFGNNESGKTTLVEFIRAMLYGERTGKRGRLPAAVSGKSYRPWNGEACAGVLEYALDDGSSFRVDRNFGRGTVHIRDGASRDISAGFPLARDTGPQFAEAHLNMTAAVFERSAMIRQLQCSMDDAGREALLEKLANLSATGSEEQSARKALDALNAALLEKVGTERSTTRPLDIVKAGLAALEARRNEIIAMNEYWLDSWLRLKGARDRLRQLKGELSALTSDRDGMIARRLLATRDECMALADLIEKKRTECRRLEERLLNSEKFAEVTENTVEALNSCRYEYREAEELLKRSMKEIETLRNRERSLEERLALLGSAGEKTSAFYGETHAHREALNEASSGREKARGFRAARFAAVVFFVAAAGAVVLAVTNNAGNPWLAAGAAALSLTAGILLLANRSWKKHGYRGVDAEWPTGAPGRRGYASTEAMDAGNRVDDVEMLYEACRKDLEEAETRRSSIIARKNDIAARVAVLLGDPGAEGWSLEEIEAASDAFRAGYRQYLEDDIRLGIAKRELGETTERMNLLLREASAIAKKDIRSKDDLAAVVRGIEAEGPSALGAIFQSWQEIEERINRVAEEIKDTEIEIKGLETRLEDVPPLDELARLDEEKAALLGRKERLESAGRSLRLAAEVLEAAARHMEKSFSPSLNGEMGRLAAIITDGRYSAVRIDPDSGLLLETPESEELMPVGCLSAGAIDQIYFAMRLSAVALIERGRETIPLFLDEPFSQYDQERARRAMLLLAEESKRRQVFLFTCSLRELELAQEILGEDLNIIELT